MNNKWIAVVGILVLTAGLALAHGDRKHIVGTLEKVGSNSVVVKTSDGKSVEVKLISSTVFIVRNGGVDKAATVSDMAPGDRVVIHATPKGETLEANEVKFSKSGSPSAHSR